MPPSGAMYELTTTESILRHMFVVDENEAVAQDTSALVHGAAVHVTLPKQVRRIRVTVADVTVGTKIWFCFGTKDRTGNQSGRILVGPSAPFDIILECPEDSFWFRRVNTSGEVYANIFATP